MAGFRTALGLAVGLPFQRGAGSGAPLVLPERLNHVVQYGQSLALGQVGNPGLTTTQKYDARMFTGGLLAGSAAGDMTGFVNLVEAFNETGAAAAVELPIDLIASENGRAYGTHDVQFMVTIPAVSGRSSLLLSPMQPTGYNYFKTEAGNAKTVADAVPVTYATVAATWRQGEADNGANVTIATYKRQVRALFQMMENEAWRVNPSGAVDMVFIVYQLASHKKTGIMSASGDPVIAWALLEMAQDPDTPIFMSNPTYYLPHVDDIHLTNTSYRQLGAAEGVMLKRLLVDQREVLPLAPSTVAVNAAEILLTYPMEPGRSLVLDTTIVTAATNFGFELRDSVDAALTINSVALVGSNQVLITAAASVPSGATLYYARSGTSASGPVAGPRGNLRDNQGDTITVLVSSVSRPVHRWAAIWRQAL